MPEPCYLIRCSWVIVRPLEPAEVIGVEFVTSEGKEARACFKVRYFDDKIDWVPVEAVNSYSLIPKSKVILTLKGIYS